MVTKKPEKVAASAAESTSKQVIETIHDPTQKPASLPNESQDDEEADYITYPPAEQFSKLSGFQDSFSYLGKHSELACQKYSDQILAEAFRLEMKGQSKEAKNCVHQSLVLQYCGLLGQDGIAMFFKRCVIFDLTRLE